MNGWKKVFALLSLFFAVLLGTYFGCNKNGSGIVYKVFGLNFSPYMDGQDPGEGFQVEEDQLRMRMKIIAPFTEWIRTYGSTNGLEISGLIAHSLGLKAALGAWISSDLVANEEEIERLINAGELGEADMLIVGSEVLRRGDISEEELINYINRVKQEINDTPVSYADTYYVLLEHKAVIDAVDVVLANYYPYWDGIKVENAVAAIHFHHQELQEAAVGKRVIVSETGWPDGGNAIGGAIASPENASFYFLDFVSWANANDVEYFYFEAFDESWKAAYEGPQGACWGVWDKFGKMKPGMGAVFKGAAMAGNWSETNIPGGAGEPVIEFTYVPPYGSFDELEGQVWHVYPYLYNVAVYIYVTGWWTKPYWNKPLTFIQIDGSWICDITTGGIDERARKIAAFLVPIGYGPPLMSGESSLPQELYQNAVAYIIVTRSP